MNGDDDKGLLWKLPVVKSDHFGKVGPAFGIGAGCGLGFGLGLLGENDEEALLRIPGAILNLIDKDYSVELACGDFSVICLRQGDNVVAMYAHVVDEIQWPLAKDAITVKVDDSHYFFSFRISKECFGKCEEERGGAGWFRGKGGFAEGFGVGEEEGDDGGAVRGVLDDDFSSVSLLHGCKLLDAFSNAANNNWDRPLLNRVGVGPGIPGFQVGFGFGAGCGVGLGFGYGVGKGIAQDDNKRYSNVGNPFRGSRSIISEDDITALVDDLVINTKKLIKATSKEIDKWRR
ncbi:Protein EARLY-RESPONSIVE TO DEHYDRATION 7, chloroplastic [Glycine soja]|uniref:Protein EARLY-RESPONSIVE TO DEHYDRATION 7, chloroplastic n=1 Tax=Glycine soja TaxID=3848 RepID=A0A445J1G9_GLYSO|nr:Protein EARLY-RESPONSIVE TO DEHYDRATION 7, chloroplastic [Glycine soja]